MQPARPQTEISFDDVAALLVVLDREGRILRWNRACSDLTGYSQDEARGRHVWDFLLVPEEQEAVRSEFARIQRAGSESAFENYWVAKDGSRRWIRWLSLASIRPDGEIDHVVATGLDETERKEACERLRELELSLRREIQHREELTRTIVHELRSPLNAIALVAELQLRSRDTPAHGGPDSSEGLRASALKMARLLDDLLDESCIRVGRLSVRRSPIPIAKLLDDAVQSARAQASTKRIVVRSEISGELPLAEADPRRIAQVLDNLIGNALKFTPDGGLVTVSAEEHAKEVRVSVKDSGPGIAVEQVGHVFEPFWQAESGDRRGAGLGLAIAKGIIEAHQGRIWVETRSGPGATLSFTLPKASRSAEQCA